ncbi:methionine--tRNA ligase [Aquibaculum arenosum]|uniref:Methionine--tRNA ligase n=1 Tax=Aquibaculum arenosum TaxID=3032591 RepID=A0ABT5YMK8_9PROT|nr:methionine--tRNA ligase [Fodinicurvata sp. CAU 1616]MDF2096197.1 methionine--tRNA ligase [Fodinicurvata sp. CAU 1616]
MSVRTDSYYITTPIYYVNDVPHIGHAYTTLACDVLARFMRLDGKEVFFLTGTDEHGQKVEKSAQKAGEEPQAFTDRVSQNFRDLAAVMNFSYDDFIRTTEERHHRSCQALWEKLVASGDIYLDKYAGWYAVRDEAFYGEDELTKTEDGKLVAPSGAEVEWVEEPSYFFRLSDWQDRLLDHYERNPDFIGPESRRNEVVSFVKGGLRNLSVSRTTFNWGIPVPGDPEHIMYVWLDALTNYITAAGYPDTESDTFRQFWPANLHMVGKDILRFHAVYWPAFLMAADVPLPRRVFAHGWLMNRGQKMSKSIGNVLRPQDLVDTYGLDPVRYYLLREVPFGSDGYISHESMVARINGDLANDLGNLAQRVLSMIAKNCGGAVPEAGELQESDQALLDKAAGLRDRLRELYDQQAFHRGLEATWQVVGDANRYVDEQAPWALRKTDPARMQTVLWVLAETVRRLALLNQPVMPDAMAAMLDQLAVPTDARNFDQIEAALVPGTPLPRPQGVFPRFVEAAEEGGA